MLPYIDTKSSQIFALYTLPDTPFRTAAGKIPAVVLVHGGGGTAFKEWVKNGMMQGLQQFHLPLGKNFKASKWQKYLNLGPFRQGTYCDFSIPIYSCGFLDRMENQYKKASLDNLA